MQRKTAVAVARPIVQKSVGFEFCRSVTYISSIHTYCEIPFFLPPLTGRKFIDCEISLRLVFSLIDTSFERVLYGRWCDGSLTTSSVHFESVDLPPDLSSSPKNSHSFFYFSHMTNWYWYNSKIYTPCVANRVLSCSFPSASRPFVW